jgi:hypothetical protein
MYFSKLFLVFVFVFLLQFPALAAECPLPDFPSFSPDAYAYDCATEEDSGDDTPGCTSYTSELVGTWAQCIDDDTFYVYALYHRFMTSSPVLGRSAFIASSVFLEYSSFSVPATYRSLITINSSLYNSAYNSIDTIINESAFCWCPPPPCLFPQCVVEEIVKVFPFDIFLGIPNVPLSCPSVSFFDFYYELCFLYEALRLIKYPIAVSLLIKIVMHL